MQATSRSPPPCRKWGLTCAVRGRLGADYVQVLLIGCHELARVWALTSRGLVDALLEAAFSLVR